MLYRMRASWWIAIVLVGCGAAGPPPARAPSADLSSFAQWTCGEATDATASQTVARHRDAREVEPISRYRTVRIENRPTDRFARRGRRIDVRLERARLSNAFRLLAEAANLGIVLGEGLDREISVDLRRVRPVEAMQVLAEAHDIDLRVIGQTVVAQRRNGT